MTERVYECVECGTRYGCSEGDDCTCPECGQPLSHHTNHDDPCPQTVEDDQ